MSDVLQQVHHLDRLCRCGHHDFDHASRYYETGDRSPKCKRKGCACAHFTVSTEAVRNA